MSMKTNFKYPIEFFALVGLVFFLPSLEAPKNILWLVFAIMWLINRLRDKSFGGAWDRWDSLIALWIGSGYAVAAFSGLHNSEWGGANDILRYGSILWMIKRSGYGRTELQWLLATLAISTLLALADAFWRLYVSHTKVALELHSVGHVNHSAIYLAISYGALLSLTLSFWKKFARQGRLFSTIATALFAAAIFISASRAAVGVALILTLLIGAAWLRRTKYPLLVLLLVGSLVTTAAYVGQIEVVQKQQGNEKAGNVLAYRDIIWNTALVAWKEYPLFGVGMHNYNQISMDKVKGWLEKSGKPYVKSRYGHISHGHSLYINALAERGLVGTGILLAVLLAWFYSLAKGLPRGEDEDIAWALWGSAFSAWFVTVGIGFANTTLHHEHAILAVILLGAWLAYQKLAPSLAR